MISRFSALVGLESTWLNYLSLPSFLSIAFVCRCCLVTKSCLTLCDPMDCSLPGSSSMEFPRQEHWEWIAISSSRGSSQPRDRIHVSCVSCTGRRILYHWATREAHIYPCVYHMILKSSVYLMYLKNCFMASRIVLQVGFSKKQILRQTSFFSFVVAQSLSRVWLFGIPWTAAHQASLSFTIPWSLLKLMSIELMMPSNHLIVCHPLLLLSSIFPSIRIFSNESVLCIRWPKYWASAAGSVLSLNIQDWLPLGLTGLLSLQSKGLSRVFFLVYKMFIQEHPWDQHLWKGGGNRSGSREKSCCKPSCLIQYHKELWGWMPFQSCSQLAWGGWASFTLLEERKNKFQRARKKNLHYLLDQDQALKLLSL